ncbi:hypothetical protein SAMN05428949_2415 [Chitinophaga sp. YR627]|uniref:HmuY family protein n=1 Tax=Chitinophaga sp. YR627 TaxID=1881041 RepID=UPI0008E7200B|nr:HmuY family protein [Chitinophaga sp. YR627]SFN32207.1 hypothetical protein SAMN05428949_2415 [Chitinophaga sp. YR627]
MIVRMIYCLMVAVVLCSACGKVYDLNGVDWEADVPPSDSVFNREIQILNLGAHLPDGHQPLDDTDPMFFSLERFGSIGIGYRSTDRWDLAFSGMARANITANNGAKSGFGYGTSAVGGLVVLDAAFDDVTEIPDDSQFKYPGQTGLDDQGAFGQPLGHVVYTFEGNFLRPDIMKDIDNPDPAIQVQVNKYRHMIYCLSQETVKTFKSVRTLRPRTIIIKTAKGNYAKMETQSLYDGIMDAMQMRRDKGIKMPVYSFRYVLAKAGEKRFGFMVNRPKITVTL